MKKTSALILAVALLAMSSYSALAQVKIPKGSNHFVYYQLEHGDKIDTSLVSVICLPDGRAIISTPQPSGRTIKGFAQTVTIADYNADSITMVASYPDSAFFYRTPFSRSDIAWEVDGQRHTCHINSNTLDFEIDDHTAINVNPLPYYGLNRGVLRTFSRNGQTRLVLAKATREKTDASLLPDANAMYRVEPRELDRIMKDRLVVRTNIFDHVQLHWGEANTHIDGQMQDLPFDTVLHFAGGTLALKRVSLPHLPAHYQHFIELHQRSNGDAYDRTGSVFIIPPGQLTFFDGINNHPDSLPTFTGRDGERYQGMIATDGYEPPIELVRFFTPFGIGHFNQRMQGFGIDWRDETLYRQEITDLYQHCMGGTTYIGVWIGNYDAGGHILTVDIKSYPNAYTLDEEDDHATGEVISLFNTCNVLEMAGQNYGKLFATDSLRVNFNIPTTAKRATLRLISTGHGGWGEGDEFVPKQNTIIIDGSVAFTHTPWRSDCSTFRDLNPVSGNFWNGVSSSDLSRSGWCPGTATCPVYFDLSPWIDDWQHTLCLTIPQGQPVDGMFSHWAVSGQLIIEY